MVFRKRGRLKIDEKWTYSGLNVEVVDSFNYLGTVFKYNGNFALTVLCQLFDAFVGSILSYSSEVWGYTKSKEIERVHLNFCKRFFKYKNEFMFYWSIWRTSTLPFVYSTVL